MESPGGPWTHDVEPQHTPGRPLQTPTFITVINLGSSKKLTTTAVQINIPFNNPITGFVRVLLFALDGYHTWMITNIA